MRIFLVLALVLSLVVTIFAVQNNTEIDVTFLSWQATGSLALVLMVTVLIGIGIGVLLMLPGSVRARFSTRTERKRGQQLEGEIAGLKNALNASANPVDPTAVVHPPGEDQPTAGQ